MARWICSALLAFVMVCPTAAPVSAAPPYDVLAHFRSELAENGAPSGVMINTPAMIAAPFQEGRVVLISCHPEQSLPWVIERALRWTTAPVHKQQ